MTFIDPAEIAHLNKKLSSDPSQLGRLYKAKRNEYYVKSVDHNLVEGMIKDGWEDFTTPLKTKTKLRKPKSQKATIQSLKMMFGASFMSWDIGI